MDGLVTAKCTRCLASATDKTFEDARIKIDHAVGLSRSIPCGDNYGCVVEIKTNEESYKKVEGKSSEKIQLDESVPDLDTVKPKIPKPKAPKSS